MHIKGKGQDLYIGKNKAILITMLGKSVNIIYDNLRRIDFQYASFSEVGYIRFVNTDGRVKRFEFSQKSNDDISNAIKLIDENHHDSFIIFEYHVEDLKFYQRSWFAILMMFCCCFPVGLYMMWYYKKFSGIARVIITVVFFSLWGYRIIDYIQIMNSISDTMDSITNSIYRFHY